MALLELSQWEDQENSTGSFCHGPLVNRYSMPTRVSIPIARACHNLWDPMETLQEVVSQPKTEADWRMWDLEQKLVLEDQIYFG